MPDAPAPPSPMPRQGASLSTFLTIFTFLLVLILLFDPPVTQALGKIVGTLFDPLIGFNETQPIVTLFLAGIIMTGLTIVLRHFFTDYVEQAESQKIVSAFNKELRQARVENNKYKIKKLTEQQMKIMQRSMDVSKNQMKLMPLTMLVVIPIFAWVAVFIGNAQTAGTAFVNLPWAMNVQLWTSNITLLPHWVLLYSLISIPFGQILMRTLRYFEFKNRLKELEAA